MQFSQLALSWHKQQKLEEFLKFKSERAPYVQIEKKTILTIKNSQTQCVGMKF